VKALAWRGTFVAYWVRSGGGGDLELGGELVGAGPVRAVVRWVGFSGVTLPLALAEMGLIDEYELVVQPRLAGHGPTRFSDLSGTSTSASSTARSSPPARSRFATNPSASQRRPERPTASTPPEGAALSGWSPDERVRVGDGESASASADAVRDGLRPDW
jgi:hypothetical protein